MTETNNNGLEVTPKATEQLEEYFKDRDRSPIRIFLNEGG